MSFAKHTSPCSCALKALKGFSCFVRAACRDSIWMRFIGTVREMLKCKGSCCSAAPWLGRCCAAAVPASVTAAAVPAFVGAKSNVGQRYRPLQPLAVAASEGPCKPAAAVPLVDIAAEVKPSDGTKAPVAPVAPAAAETAGRFLAWRCVLAAWLAVAAVSATAAVAVGHSVRRLVASSCSFACAESSTARQQQPRMESR